MSITLRQNTTADNFSEATSSGSLLICVVDASCETTINGTVTINTPTTSGFTWTKAKGDTFDGSFVVSGVTHYSRGGISVYYIENASSMSSATTTACTATDTTGTPTVSFRMYEFTGALTSGVVDATVAQETSSQTGSTITAGTLNTSDTDLIFVATSYASPTHGSGYTSGVVNSDQYILNQTAGSIDTAFATSSGFWATVAVGFSGVNPSQSAFPSGVKGTFAVNAPTTQASSSIAATGVAADFALGTALPGGGVSFASPLGVSLSSGIGAATAGVPINYGNVVTGSSGLPTGVNSTYFYVRWTGWITVTVPGIYTFGLNIQDGGDFYIGTQPVVNALSATQTAHTSIAYTNSSTVELAANIAYPLVIEWQHGSGANYECQLLWTPPGGSVELIPPSYLSLTGKWWNGTSSSFFPNTWY